MISNIKNTEFPFKRAADFNKFEYNQLDVDTQGWGGNHPIFAELIKSHQKWFVMLVYGKVNQQ
jgi:hypothetical protein